MADGSSKGVIPFVGGAISGIGRLLPATLLLLLTLVPEIAGAAGPATAANSSLTSTPGVRVADGIATHTATVTARDAGNNLVEGATFAFGITPSSAIISPSSCTSGSNGTCQVSIATTVATAYRISATLDGVEINFSPANLGFIAGHQVAATSSLEVSTGSRQADGVDAHTATVTARDIHENLVSGAIIAFAAGDAATSAPTCTTGPFATCVISITSDQAGVFPVRAFIDGDDVRDSPAQVEFEGGAAVAGASSLLVSDGTRIANGSDSHTATVTARAANGNPVAGVVVAFTIGAGASLSAPSCTTGGDGSCEVGITSAVVGTYELGATIDAVAVQGSPAGLAFTAGPPLAANSSLATSTGNRIADGADAHTATVAVRDASDHPVANVGVQFAVAAGASLSAAECVTAANGVCDVEIISDTVGVHALAASIAGATLQGSPADLAFVAGAAAAVNSSLVVSTGTRIANGSDAHTATATARDANNNPVSGATVSFTVGSGASLSAPTCTTGGDGSCEVSITSSAVGTYSVTATLDGTGLQNSPAEVSFVAGAASATSSTLAVSTGTRIANGSDTHTATATARDVNNNPVSGATISFTVGSGVTLSAPSCTTSVDGSCEVSVTSAAVGTYSITATLDGAGLQNSPTEVAFVAGAASAASSTLAVSTGTRIANGSDAHTATATARDANNNPVGGATVSFTVGSGASLSVPTCTTGGDGSCEVTITSASVGTYPVTASLDGADLQNSPAEVSFVAGAASATSSTLVVSTGTRIANGSDVHMATATARDANSNPVSDAVVSFAVGSGASLSAPSCTTVGDGSCEVTITSPAVGTYPVTATLDGVGLQNSPAEVAFVAGAASATNSTLVVSTGTRVANGSDPHVATATARDANNNPVSGATVSFTVESGASLSASTCTTGGDGSCEVSITSSAVGTYSVTAALDGAGLQNSPADVAFVAGAASATSSTLAVSTGTRVANGSDAHTATATVRDVNNNPVGGATVSFTVGSGASLSAPTCTTGSDGSCEVTITSASVGTYSVTATLDGTGLKNSPAEVTFVAGAASATGSMLAVSTGTRIANGSDAHTATATARDANNNPVSGATISFTVGFGASLSVPTCTTAGDGSCEVTITSSVFGTYPVTATLDGTGLQNSPAEVTFVAGAASATSSTLAVSTGTRIANGSDAHAATATARDANNNPVGGATVAFAVGPGASLSAPTCTTGGDGSCEVAVISAAVGTYSVTATLDGIGLQNSPAEVAFVAGAASATSSTLAVSTGNRIANGSDTHTATATARDANNNPVSGAIVNLTVGSGASLSASTCTTDGDGSCEVTITSSVVGTYSVTATLDGTALQNSPAEIAFVAGDAVAANSVLTVSSGTRIANGSDAHTATAMVRDASNNPVSGTAVSFTIENGAVLSAPTCTTSADGGCEVAVTSSTAGTYALTATLAGAALQNSPAEVTFVAGTAMAANSVLALSTSTRLANGNEAHTATATARDASGNSVADTTISFTVDSGATLSASTCSTGSDGRCEVTVTSAAVGSYAVAASLDGASLQNSPGNIAFVAGAAVAANSALTTSTGTRIANGSDAHTVTVTARDADNHPVSGATFAFTVETGATLSASNCITATDGSCVVTVTSTTAAIYSLAAALDGNAVQNSPATVAFIADAASGANSTLTISTGTRVADGRDAHVATALVRDVGNNPISGATVNFAVGAGASLSAASCATAADGRCEVTITSTSATAHAITASVDGATLQGSPADAVFVAGPPDAANSTLGVSGGDRVADGSDLHIAVVAVRDTNNNPVEGVPVQFAVNGAMTFASQSCVTGSNGSCSVTGSSTTPGTFAINAMVKGAEVSNSPAAVIFVTDAAVVANSSLTISNGTRIADGSDAHSATVIARDASNNPVAGVVVSFAIAAGASVSAETCTTAADGRCEVAVTSIVAAAHALTASLNNDAIQGSPADAVFVAGAADAANSMLSVSGGERIADGSDLHLAAVVVRDANNNPVEGVPVGFSTDGVMTFAAQSCVTDSNGRCSVTGSSSTPGTFAINAMVKGAEVSNSPAAVVFVADAALAVNSSLSLTTGTRFADGTDAHTATVVARDGGGNPVAAAMVDFIGDTDTLASPSSCVTAADGSCSVEITSEVVGTHSVGARIAGEEVQSSPGAVEFVVGTAVAAESTLETSDDARVADGIDAHTATVTARDAAGRLVAGARVDFANSPEAVLSAYSCTTLTDGTCTVTVTSAEPGTHTLDALIAGNDVAGSPASLRFASGVALSMDKTIDAQPLRVGKPFNYLLSFDNQGTVTAQQVNFNDLVPAGIRILAAPMSASCTVDGGVARFPLEGNGATVLSCVVATQVPANGGTAVVSLPAVALPVAAGTTPVNYASWSQDGVAPPEFPGLRPDGGCVVNCTNDGGPTRPVEADGDNAALRIVKRANQRMVRIGDLVAYTVTINNQGKTAIDGFALVDTPAAGFTYVEGSLTVSDGAPSATASGYRPIRISGLDIAAEQTLTLQYLLRVGAAVRPGTYSNQAQAFAAVSTMAVDGAVAISNVAVAEVTVQAADPLLTEALVFGTVFNDRNGNGFQDEGEKGIAGVEIMSVEGLIAETDRFGRYHMQGIDGGNLARGRNFILKLNLGSLPAGSVPTTENPLLRRITQGMPVRFDFGVRMRDDLP